MSAPELIALAEYSAWANEKAFGACAALSAEQLARATVYSPTIELLRHLVHVQLNFLRMFQGQGRRQPPPAEFAELRAIATAIGEEYVTYLKSGPDLEARVHVPWFGFDISVREAMLQALTHSIKHRSDVCIALPEQGVAAPGLDFIHWIEARSG